MEKVEYLFLPGNVNAFISATVIGRQMIARINYIYVSLLDWDIE